MNAVDLYTRCDAAFRERLAAVDGRWAAPTALPGWDVRALVHHIVVEERWAPPIFAGLTIGEVGDIFEGDQLVPDPLTAARDASGAALDAVREDGAMERTVHLSFGETPAVEYARQLAADHLVHAWDLARALGVDDTLDPEAVHAVAEWFEPTEDALARGGRDRSPRAGAGRRRRADPDAGDVREGGVNPAVERFTAAFDAQGRRRDHGRDDAGLRVRGHRPARRQAARRHRGGAGGVDGALRRLSPTGAFTTEEVIDAGDRVVTRWRYDFDGGHVRGVDVFRVRDGLVAEKFSYVKG